MNTGYGPGFEYSEIAHKLEQYIFDAIYKYTTEINNQNQIRAFCVNVSGICMIYQDNISKHKSKLLSLLDSEEKNALKYLETIFKLSIESKLVPLIAKNGITEANLKDPKFISSVNEIFPKIIEQLGNLDRLLKDDRYILILHKILLKC